MPDGTLHPVAWDQLIRAEAARQQVNPALALAVARTESSLNPDATSKAGAIGLMQLMPETAQRLGVDPHNPVENIRGGVMELKRLLTANHGDVAAALRGYNASPEAPRSTTDPYVQKVLGQLDQTAVGTAPPAGQAAPGAPTAPGGGSQVGQPPPTPESWGQWLLRQGRETLQAFNPMTSGGRQNLAGGAGAAAAVALAPETFGLSAAALPILGAGLAGGAETAVDEAAHGQPLEPGAITGAAGQQALNEGIGRGAMGIVNSVGKRLIAPVVVRQVSKRVAGAIESAKGVRQEVIDRLGEVLDSLRGLGGESRSARAIGVPPSAARAGRQAVDLAGDVRAAAGKAVGEAAATGPTVDLAPVKAHARAIVEQEAVPTTETADMPGAGYLKNAMGSRGAASAADQSRFLQALQAAGVPLEPSHPLPGALAKLESAPDEVSFSEAHNLKQALDESVNWDRGASRKAEQQTKAVRQSLREAMGHHPPYEQATAQYHHIMDLYQAAPLRQSLKRTALSDPEQVVRLIKPNNPTGAAMLRELLTTPVEGGPGALEGQQALAAVQAAWIHDNLVRPGIEKLSKNLEQKVPYHFERAFLSTPDAAQVIDHLRTISSAYDQAVATEKTQPAELEQLAKSSLVPKGTAADWLRAAVLVPHGAFWGFVSLVKIMKGPTAQELLKWAAASPESTQALVRAFTSPVPALAMADLVRKSGILGTVGTPPPLQPVASHPSSVGAPPPQ